LILAFHEAWHQPASEAHAVNFAGSTRSMCIVLQDLMVSLERTQLAHYNTNICCCCCWWW